MTQSRSWLAPAGIYAAIVTWMLQVVAGRALGADEYAHFMVAWGWVFFAVGGLLGVQQHTTRSADVMTAENREHSPVLLSVLFGGALATVVMVLVNALTSTESTIILALAFGVLSYATYHAANGVLAANQQWATYSWLVIGEATIRTAALCLILLLGWGLPAQYWGLVLAGLTWLALLFTPASRGRLLVGSTLPWRMQWRDLLAAVIATSASALLVSGFPALLGTLAPTELDATAGGLIAAVVITRAPLLLALNAYQGVILTLLMGPKPADVLARLTMGTVLVTGLGAAVGWAWGEPILRMLYGPTFFVDGATVAMLVIAAGLLTEHSLTALALLGRLGAVRYSATWMVSVGVTIAALALPVSLEQKVLWSLLGGPSAGLALSLVMLRSPLITRLGGRSSQPDHEGTA